MGASVAESYREWSDRLVASEEGYGRTDQVVDPVPALSEAEWGAIDAMRAGADATAAAKASGIEENEFRRTLSTAAEKLRMTSALPPKRRSVLGGRMHVPHRHPCPYCENFAGRYSPRLGPPAVIYEDDVVFVSLTVTPLGGMPGHTLVTTRRHVETIFDVSETEAARLGMAVAQAARAIRAALDPEGVLIQQNNGAAAFQTVPHIHFHVVPKMIGPFPPLTSPAPQTQESLRAMARKIRAHW